MESDVDYAMKLDVWMTVYVSGLGVNGPRDSVPSRLRYVLMYNLTVIVGGVAWLIGFFIEDTLKRTELAEVDMGNKRVKVLAILPQSSVNRLSIGVHDVSDSWYSVGRMTVRLVLFGNTNGDVIWNE